MHCRSSALTKANTLQREIDTLKFKDGETADKFGVCINGIVNRLSPCSETIKALHCD